MITIAWQQCPAVFATADEPVEVYESFEIRLIVPNGGILGASVVKDGWAFQFHSAGRFNDQDWHVQECKKFIDSIGWASQHLPLPEDLLVREMP